MEISRTVRNGAKEHIYWPMNQNTLDTGLIIISKALENIVGPMEEFTKENGKKISCTVVESTPGPMVVCTMVTTKMTKNMAWAPIPGQTVRATKGNG